MALGSINGKEETPQKLLKWYKKMDLNSCVNPAITVDIISQSVLSQGLRITAGVKMSKLFRSSV